MNCKSSKKRSNGFTSEDRFQQATASLLRSLGWLAWHTPNERKNKNERMKLSSLGVLPGVSDWFIAEFHIDGGFGVFIELKMPNNKETQAQQNFIKSARERGCIAEVCKTWDEFISVLKKVMPKNGRYVR